MGFWGGPVDFLIHWPPGPVVATVQCQGLSCIIRTILHITQCMLELKSIIEGISLICQRIPVDLSEVLIKQISINNIQDSTRLPSKEPLRWQ